MCVRAVKAMARLSVCADASEHWMIKYLISVKSLMSHTKQPFSFENSGILLFQMAFNGNFNITSKPGQVIFGIYRICVKSLIKLTSSPTKRG